VDEPADTADPTATVVSALGSTTTLMAMTDSASGPSPLGPTAPHLNYNGGRVLGHVDINAVFWGGGVNATVATRIPTFYDTIAQSSYMDWLSEYSTTFSGGTHQVIGRGSLTGAFTISPNNASKHLTDAGIQTELAQQIDAHALPAPTSDGIYMLHFPPGVSITAFGENSCQAFCAYHESFVHNGKNVTYGVIPDFGPGSGCDVGCGGSTQFNNTTSASSHELIEAVTDPDFKSAWWSPADDEIGDICNAQQGFVPGTGYIAQKQWSNQASACLTVGPRATVMYTPGDFNGDGKTDLVITTANGSFWYFSNGNGTWSVPYTRSDLPLGAVSFTPGDFNGDGKTDLVITTVNGSFWYFSNGNGTWTVPYTRSDLPL
jgi:hypothetical protein